MKFLIVAFALVAYAVAEVAHIQPGAHIQPVAILKQAQDTSPDGSYSHSFETENGIFQTESGTPVVVEDKKEPVVVVQGQYQYTSPDGVPVVVNYVADQNGFQPQGDHIPTIPPLIARALEYIRAHPRVEDQ